ncbi:MAG: OmpA family protein [Chitinophagaceae bacterium]
MSFNLLDSVKGLFTTELIGKASNMLGEDPNNVQKAVSGIVPSVLTGILNKAGSGDAGGILGMAKDAMNSGILSNIGGFFGNDNILAKGADMLRNLFGDKLGNITSMISGFSGIKSTSANSLLSMAAPAALGVLGKHASDNNMSSGGLLSFLNQQKDGILNSLPSGLNLAGALGLGSLGSIGSKLSGAISGVTSSAKQAASGGSKWLWPLILIIAAILLIWYLMKGCNNNSTTATETTTPVTDTPVISTTPATVVMESIKVTLPDGVVLDAYKGGIEDQLVTFLKDPTSQPGKDVWFDFDNLNFETGSANITAESMKQVDNIVAILKAFPTTAIKIGGYTDRTGDSVANLKLSQSRAESVTAAIKGKGTPASQLEKPEGYGSQFAKAAADAPDEERKKDRRIAVSVRKK